MWLFNKNPSSSQKVHPRQPIKNAYLIQTKNDTKVYETKYDAQVEALRLDLLTGIEKTVILEVSLFGPSKSSIAFPAKSSALEFDDLPEHVKKEIDEHNDAIRLSNERDEAIRKNIALKIHDQWSIIVDEYRNNVERSLAARDAAIKAFVKDRSVSSSRVREICDAKSKEISALRMRAYEQGSVLVDEASNLVGISVELDDLKGLIPDIDSIALDASFENVI